jgi:hypothetical protein
MQMIPIDAQLAMKKDRLNSLRNSFKNIKCPGVIKRLTREIRNLEKRCN